ncbi:MAG: alpha/beta hydrolase fold protein [bacterium]|nr:MAG: alpha/beta hydrolase fold protein [bacterium]
MSFFKLSTEDNHEIFVHAWAVDTPRKVFLIAHGMAEHGARYASLAAFLNTHSVSVYAIDHRGHGKSVRNEDELGHFTSNPNENGWGKVIADLHKVTTHLRTLYPTTPLVLFGHSMGSFISLGYAIRYGDTLNALILSGSNSSSALVYQAARTIALLESWRQGVGGKSNLLYFLSFSSFNKRFEPVRTKFDWLSRDPAQVDLYINDAYCGFQISNQSWVDLLGGLIEISQRKRLAHIPSHLPVYIFGGAHDPVGGFGKGLGRLADELGISGISNLKLRLYPEGRHEMINEINNKEVFNDIIDWLDNF